MQAYVKRDEYKRFVVKVTSEMLVKIGAQLKEARERKFYGIKDISQRTCIPAHHILGIELGDRKKLPEDIFLISFIKKYARVVGLNEDTIFVFTEQDAFDLLFQEEKSDNIIHFKRRQAGLIKGCHVYLLIGFLLFVFASYLLFNDAGKKFNSLESNSNLAYDDSIYRPNIDFNKVESWVGEGQIAEKLTASHKLEIKKQVIIRQEVRSTPKSHKPIVVSHKQAVKQEIKQPKAISKQLKTIPPKAGLTQIAKNQPASREIKLRPLR